MNETTLPPKSGIVVTHYLTVADIERASDFYVRVFDAQMQRRGSPTVLKLANAWLILNTGGGPTDDKPDIRLETPADLGTASSFLNIRVADIANCYALWRKRGATFITEPKDHGREIRCYLRDLDGYLIEVGQSVT